MTSVLDKEERWRIDHLRNGDQTLTALLERRGVLAHPFVIGELALGSLRQREVILSALHDLPSATVAGDAEVMGFIERHSLHGRGMSDKRLHAVATQLDVAASDP